MRLRAANSSEAFPLVDILLDRHVDTIYAGHVEIDEPLARKIIAHAIHRHGGTNEGATFVMVAVDDDDAPQAFVMGSLVRVYGIGKMLEAVDNYLVGRRDVPAPVLDRLFGEYVSWAIANPKVHEVQASYTDVIPGSDRFDMAYRRKGFVPCGAIFRRLPHAEAEEKAA